MHACPHAWLVEVGGSPMFNYFVKTDLIIKDRPITARNINSSDWFSAFTQATFEPFWKDVEILMPNFTTRTATSKDGQNTSYVRFAVVRSRTRVCHSEKLFLSRNLRKLDLTSHKRCRVVCILCTSPSALFVLVSPALRYSKWQFPTCSSSVLFYVHRDCTGYYGRALPLSLSLSR